MRWLPFVLLLSCDFPAAQDCTQTSECRSGRLCAQGECVPAETDGAVETRIICEQHMPAHDGCLGCMAESCCEQVDACAKNPDCKPLIDCLSVCDARQDPECKRCFDALSSSVLELGTELGVCVSQACNDECEGCGGAGLAASPACTECVSSSGLICDAMTICLSDAECTHSLLCNSSCTNPKTCRAECPSFLDLDDKQLAATTSLLPCYEACDVSGDFACAGEFSWGGPASASLRYDFRLIRAADPEETPMVGVHASLCLVADYACADAIDTGVSDDDGELHFVLDASGPLGSQSVFVALTKFDEGGAKLIVPTLLFLPSPRVVVTEQQVVAVVLPEQAEELASVFGDRLPMRTENSALVAATGLDCKGVPASGVELSLDPPGGGVRAVQAGPLLNTEVTETDVSGVAIWGGVEAGRTLAQYTLKMVLDGREVGSRDFFVRPGFASSVWVPPSEK